MPPLPNAVNVVKVRFDGLNNGSKWNCITHHLMSGGSPTGADLNAFAAAMGAAWNGGIAPLCPNTVTLENVFAIDLTNNTSNQGTAVAGFLGTRAGLPLSAQVATVSSWIAPVRYRGGHPRNYWPAGVQPDLANGFQWTAAYIAAATAGFNTFRSTVNGIPIGSLAQQLCLLSYKSGKQFRPAPVPFPITGVSVHPRIDTQRRRLGKEFP